MQYEPLASETAMLASAGDLQRLDYFLLRAFETEEIWTLKQGNQWFSREVILPGHDPVIAMPLWPYRKMALDAALDVWDDCRPEATSPTQVAPPIERTVSFSPAALAAAGGGPLLASWIAR